MGAPLLSSLSVLKSRGRSRGSPHTTFATAALRLVATGALVAASLSGCATVVTPDPGTLGTPSLPPPSAPRSLVVLACSRQVGAEFDLAESAIGGAATPGEALIVIACSAAPHATTRIHVVQAGENLSEIAAANDVTLDEVERSNPSLGPAWGRDWNLIVPGDLVVLPGPMVASGPQNLLTTRAPATGPAPTLEPEPTPPPADGTDFQYQSYETAKRAVDATNTKRIASWTADQTKQAAQWQTYAVAQLRSMAGNAATAASLTGDTELPAALQEGVATLGALPGLRAVVVLTDGGAGGPPPLPSLAGVHVVVVNMTDASGLSSWSSAATAAGAASVSALTLPAAQLSLHDTVFGV